MSEHRMLRPELHVTAEQGVLEAPAGALAMDGTVHVFHQFRPSPTAGARWAHQTASSIPFDWDVCDDVLVPEGEETDVLAGSVVPVPTPEHPHAVELFFVAAQRTPGGEDHYRIERARIADLTELVDASDDPSAADPRVERLGPITLEDPSGLAPTSLVTPSVVENPHGDGWIMIALGLSDAGSAPLNRAVVAHSTDRAHWSILGPVEFTGEHADSIPGGRLFAPRLTQLSDDATGETFDVLLLTFAGRELPDSLIPAGSTPETMPAEVTGYLLGRLEGARFHCAHPFRILDYGLNFSRPRIVSSGFAEPVVVGLVGDPTPVTAAIPGTQTWSQCLTSPRRMWLSGGHIYQQASGVSIATQTYSDAGLMWAGQFDASSSEPVELHLRRSTPQGGSTDTEDATVLATVRVDDGALTVTRHVDGAVCRAPWAVSTAQLNDVADADEDIDAHRIVAIAIDGPLVEIFAEGGATTLTVFLPVADDGRVTTVEPVAEHRAGLGLVMTHSGHALQRLAARATPDDEEFLRDAFLAERDLVEEHRDDSD